MAKYAIWDKQSQVITPIGEVLTADQWKTKYPVAALENVDVVCAAGQINGAFFGLLSQMKERYEAMGADFSKCNTADDQLAVIEAFDAAEEAAEKERVAAAVSNEELTATALASIAASMEYQNMMTLDDVEV